MRIRNFSCLPALGLAALLAVQTATSQTLPPGVQKKSSSGGITEYDFPNGLRVLLYPNPASPKITVNVTYLSVPGTKAMVKRAWPICSST